MRTARSATQDFCSLWRGSKLGYGVKIVVCAFQSRRGSEPEWELDVFWVFKRSKWLRFPEAYHAGSMTLVYPAHRSSSTSLSTTSVPKLSRQSKTHRLGKHLTQAIFKTTEKRSARMECEQTITGYAGHYSLFFSLSLSATPFCKTMQACVRAINGQNIRQCSNECSSPPPPPPKP